MAIQCVYCQKSFTNAKRHATHTAECKSNPGVMARKIVPVEVNGVPHVRADDLVEFFPPAKTGRDVFEQGSVPADQRVYATLAPKRNVWTPSTADVKVARALVRVDWARANVPGLSARLASEEAEGAGEASGSGGGGGGGGEGTTITMTISDIIERLRLKEAELLCARAQILLLAVQQSERRAVELHTKKMEALERRTAAAVRASRGGATADEDEDDAEAEEIEAEPSGAAKTS